MDYLKVDYLKVLNIIKRDGINRYKSAFGADSLEDLVQQAELLALEVLNLFQGDYNSENFKVFAQKTIVGGLAAFVLDGDVEIPASTRYKYNKILRLREEIKAAKGFYPTIEEIAIIAKVSKQTVANAIRCEILMAPSQRIDWEIDGQGNTLGYYLKDPNNTIEKTSEKITREQLKKILKEKLTEMTSQERQVILGILEGKKLCEIAKQFGKKEKYARIIRNQAFRKLRKDEVLKNFYMELCA